MMAGKNGASKRFESDFSNLQANKNTTPPQMIKTEAQEERKKHRRHEPKPEKEKDASFLPTFIQKSNVW